MFRTTGKGRSEQAQRHALMAELAVADLALSVRRRCAVLGISRSW